MEKLVLAGTMLLIQPSAFHTRSNNHVSSTPKAFFLYVYMFSFVVFCFGFLFSLLSSFGVP